VPGRGAEHRILEFSGNHTAAPAICQRAACALQQQVLIVLVYAHMSTVHGLDHFTVETAWSNTQFTPDFLPFSGALLRKRSSPSCFPNSLSINSPTSVAISLLERSPILTPSSIASWSSFCSSLISKPGYGLWLWPGSFARSAWRGRRARRCRQRFYGQNYGQQWFRQWRRKALAVSSCLPGFLFSFG